MQKNRHHRGLELTRPRLRVAIVLGLTLLIVSPPGHAEDQTEASEPKLLSVYPLGARRGSTVQVELRGNWLEDSTGVWVDTSDVTGRLLKVEVLPADFGGKPNPTQADQKNPPTIYRASVELQISTSAHSGTHSLRLVGPRGVSDALSFGVVDTPVVIETSSPHATVEQAQLVDVPVVISGKLEKLGELDYYSFQASRGQNLSFEVVATANCFPRMAVYRSGGSWFDPDRPIRLLFQEELSTDLQLPIDAVRTFEAPKDGKYYLEVSGLLGTGSADSYYQIRINPRARGYQNAAPFEQIADSQGERSFTRELNARWLASLESREVPRVSEPTVQARVAGAGAALEDIADSTQEPPSKQSPHQETETPLTYVTKKISVSSGEPQDVAIPAIITGTVDHPGDVDRFKLKVQAGQKLAFEVETPEIRPPYFNPTLSILDSKNQEVFSNVERIKSLFNNNGTPFTYLNKVEPKAIYSFAKGGEYELDVHDITSRYGNSGFRYKVLVRAEAPHIGDVQIVDDDHINLVRGQAKKLTLNVSYEEGFSGDAYFRFAGLPKGVHAYAGIQSNGPGVPMIERVENPDVISPMQQKTTLVLVATADARVGSKPVMVQFYCQPVLNGKLGANRLVKELPLMVVKGSDKN